MVPKLVQEDSMTFLIQIVMLFLAGSEPAAARAPPQAKR
jgi:hypothetical protein